MERTYFELKITFIHILILLVAIILIGIMLFYMGYKAGYRSSLAGAEKPAASVKRSMEEKTLPVVEKPTYAEKMKPTPSQSIHDEQKLYPPKDGKKSTEPIPTQSDAASFFAIRVGAFSSQVNAASYGAKFEKLGYSVKVQAPDSASGKFFYVLVGKYKEVELARSEKEKLEKMEKKRFLVVPYR